VLPIAGALSGQVGTGSETCEAQPMLAMVLHEIGKPLRLEELPDPVPGVGEVRLRIEACGVCRTDLHVVDGELPNPVLPIIPGHEIVGRVDALGSAVEDFRIGDRVGVPWLGHTCGNCAYCLSGRENLCDNPLFTGYTRNGGFATHVVADARFAFHMAEGESAEALSPLLCAGLIGWRSLGFAGAAKTLGLYGFGAAAHIVAQIARKQGRTIFAFTRPGDAAAQKFALGLGAVWAGASGDAPPEPLDAAIIYAPVGDLVPAALAQVRKGGVVVCAGIHMSDIPSFPYDLLWEERRIVSVANLTRNDGLEFFPFAAGAGIETSITTYPLAAANEALADLREGRLQGAAVLVPPGEEG
jgi:propanol-preferring alcohol dehydrogenase